MVFPTLRKNGLWLNIVLLIFGTALICLFYENNLLLTGLLVAVTAIAMFLWYEKEDYLFFAVAAIVGPTFESVCISFGAWKYTNPSCGDIICLNIPCWLWAWGMIVVLIKSIVQAITLNNKPKPQP